MGTDGLRIEGFLDIEIINKKDKVRRRYHNTITNAGKKFMLDKSCGRMLQLSGDSHGLMVAHGDFNARAWSGTQPAQQYGRKASNKRSLTNVLLNLSAGELSGLSASTTYLNLWNSALSDRTKMIGFANNATAAVSGDTKQGRIDNCKGEYAVDGTCVAKRWYYPAGIASGTINAIAMMGAESVLTYKGQMFNVAKCLDKNNQVDGNFISSSTGFLIPGVPGYTANDEIMLNYDGGRWKFNITTGEMTEVAAGDPFFVFTNPYSASRDFAGIFDMKVISGKLYVAFEYNGKLKMRVYDPSNDMSYNEYGGSGITIEDSGGYGRDGKAVKFFTDGTNWSLSIIRSRDSAGQPYYVPMTFDSGANEYTIGSSAAYNYDYISGVITLPSSLPSGLVGFSNLGSNYVMWMGEGDIDDSDSYWGTRSMVGLVFSDPTDPIGSIVDAISCPFMSVVFEAGTNKGVLYIGGNAGNYDYFINGLQALQQDTDDPREYVFSPSTNGQYIEWNTQGCFLSMWGWWSNVLSFVKLNEAISKGDEDEMYVSYGYRVV